MIVISPLILYLKNCQPTPAAPTPLRACAPHQSAPSRLHRQWHSERACAVEGASRSAGWPSGREDSRNPTAGWSHRWRRIWWEEGGCEQHAKKGKKGNHEYGSIMLSIVLEMISKMCGIETSPIPEIAHDCCLTGHAQIPWFSSFHHFSHFWGIPRFLGGYPVSRHSQILHGCLYPMMFLVNHHLQMISHIFSEYISHSQQ